MKTTVNLPDEHVREAQALARREHTTLRELIETGLPAMIAVATNVLVYAHRRDAEFHGAAAARVKALAEGRAAWAVPWPCLHECFAICAHPKIYHPPSTPAQAITPIDAWPASPSLSVLGEPAGYWDRLKPILAAGRGDRQAGTRRTDHRIVCGTRGARSVVGRP